MTPTASQRERDPVATRQMILEAACQEMHVRGFQATSLNDILALTGVTKGALYHHFENKLDLGYAVVEEIIREQVLARWVRPLVGADDPISAFQQMLNDARGEIEESFIELGCPLNNLAQEMATIDDGFRERVEVIYSAWRMGITQALAQGQNKGTVRKDVNCEQAATMLVASMEGCLGMAKNSKSVALLEQCGAGIIHYLETLRP